LGDEDKIKALEKITAATGLSHDQMAFMGDDLYDIPVIEKVGFSATVPHAVDPVKARVNYITQANGGWGAVREVADAIRRAQKLGPYID
jgi:3-deoxy-D-manno-octulosonate 8-phosphate phosphatase (KDO 8-P phosphatase)